MSDAADGGGWLLINIVGGCNLWVIPLFFFFWFGDSGGQVVVQLGTLVVVVVVVVDGRDKGGGDSLPGAGLRLKNVMVVGTNLTHNLVNGPWNPP